MDLTSWWDALTGLQKIFWGIAFPFTLFFVLQTILTFIGAGGEVDMEVESDTDFDSDADGDGDDGIKFQFISLKNFAAFFTMFGWSGLACLDFGLSNITAILIATVCGVLMMLIMSSIFYFMSKLSDSGTMRLRNAIGKTGSVYLTIPSNKGGYGKVQINIQGSLRELSALTNDAESIPTAAIVKVEDVINGDILMVTKQ